MTISDVEDSIVTQIKSHVTKTHIEAYPDDWETFKLSRNNTVLVQWQGLDTEEDETIDKSIQHTINQYAVMVFTRNKRSRAAHKGGYDILRTIYENLQGFKIDQAYVSRQSQNLISRDNKTGLWIFRAVYNHFQILSV